MIISVIDDHTYAITGSGTNAQIRNITNITSPTIVSAISSFECTSSLDSIVIDDSTYLLGVKVAISILQTSTTLKTPILFLVLIWVVISTNLLSKLYS